MLPQKCYRRNAIGIAYIIFMVLSFFIPMEVIDRILIEYGMVLFALGLIWVVLWGYCLWFWGLDTDCWR